MAPASLPEFPVDDVTLLAVEHALGGALTYDRPDDADPDDEGPWLVGAEYSLSTLLDMLAGCWDPPGTDSETNPALVREGDVGGIPLYYDVRVHYSEHDLIRALIREVRRLRGGTVETSDSATDKKDG